MLSRLFRSRNSASPDLVMSELFNEHTFYPTLQNDLRRCQHELIIESPFITTKRLAFLLPELQRLIKHGVKVTVNAKPPEENGEYLQGEAKRGIALLQDSGVDVLVTGGHHRKLVIVDSRTIYEGSLNVLSQSDSCEIMRRIESERLTYQMLSFMSLDGL